MDAALKLAFICMCFYMSLQKGIASLSEHLHVWDLPGNITKLTTDTSGTIYIGGDNFVGTFSSKLNDSLSIISIGPVSGADNCTLQLHPCNNTVKVLEVVDQLGMLLVCGTAYNGTCTLHNLDNLSDWYCLDSGPDVESGILANVYNKNIVIRTLPVTKNSILNKSMETVNRGRCRDEDFGYIKSNEDSQAHVPTTSQMKHENKKIVPALRLFVAADVHYTKSVSSVTLMSVRNISVRDTRFGIHYLRHTMSQINENYTRIDSESTFTINFKYSFTWNNYTYILSTQHRDGVNQTDITKLGRVAINGANGIQYVETELKCLVDRDIYTIMTAATFTNDSFHYNDNGAKGPVLLVAYGDDADPTSDETEQRIKSAVCAFFIDEINKNFKVAMAACAKGNDTLARPVSWIKNPIYECQDKKIPVNQGAYLAMSRPETTAAVLRRNSTTSALYVSKATDALYLFLLSNDGILEKILLDNDNSWKQNSEWRVVEKFQVPHYTENVKLFVQSHENVTYVYMAESAQLIRRTVHNCQQFKRCGHCPSVTCNWCYSTRVCQSLGSLCQNNSSEVETPNGPWITPKYAPLSGGTILTVHGLDLINASSDTADIRICNQPCEILNSKGSNITCKVQPNYNSSDGDSCKIRLLTPLLGTSQLKSLAINYELTFVTPSVEYFSPSIGSVAGGTVLEFKGCYLDIGSTTQVWLGGSRCDITELNSDRLKCTTNSKTVNSPDCVNVQVLVDRFSKIISLPPFCYSYNCTFQDNNALVTSENDDHLTSTSVYQGCLDARIDSFSPHFGPVSGGTILKFKTQNLNLISDVKIMVGANNCSVVSTDNQNLTCSIRQQANTIAECVYVQVFLDDAIQNISKPCFCYKPDPVVTQVKVDPIIHGKQINITFTGTNFDSATSSKIVIFYHNPVTNESIHFKGVCFAENVTETLTCETPDLYDITDTYFQWNESRDYLEAELALEMDNRYFNLAETSLPVKLMIHRSPEFHNDTVPSAKLSKDHPILVLQVKGLTNFNRSDITVLVGSRKCPIVSLTNLTLECNVTEVIDKYNREQNNAISDESKKDDRCSPRQSSDGNLQCSVRLKIGQHVTQPLGHVTISLPPMTSISDPMKTAVLVGIGLAVLVIVSLLIVTVALLNRMKRSKSKKSDTVNGQVADGSGEVTMPTLQQILETVDADVSKQEEMRKLIFDIDKLTIGKCIGSGNFGTVFDGVLELSLDLPTEKVAVKMLQDPMSHRIDLLSFVQEAVMMRQFQHPNVLGLIGLAEQEPGIPLVILPFLENGDLLTYVRNESLSLTLHDVIKFGADIANGMTYLSSLKFVHRDLAARNCMLDSEYRVKVADFGLCRDIYEKGYYTSDNKKVLPIRWMALESIENGTYSTKSDVWSLGVVIWEMLTRGLTPYPGVDGWDVVNYLRHRRLPPPYFCPEPLFNLMMMCWANEPKMRPTFKAIQMELLLLIDGGRTDRVKEDKDDHSAKSDTLNASLPSKTHNTPVTENSGQSLAQREDHKQGSSTNNAVACNETPCNEQKPPSKEISPDFDKTTHAGEVITLAVGSTHDTQVITRDIDSANRDTSSDVLSVPQPTVVEDVLITIPECYSHGDVSSKALGTYVELVANYEPPRSYLGSFLTPSPGCSATVPELIENTLSDAGRDYVWLSEEGAYYKADQDI